MALAGALELQMFANLARLTKDMGDAKRLVGGAMGNIESAVGSAKAVLGSLGIGLGVGYFASLIKGSIDAADRLRDLSITTSISVSQLAGLQLASKQTGGDLESIAASINKLSVNIGKDTAKFAALGVSAKDPLEAFKQLSDVFIQIQDPQQRAAVMAEALGKSWAGAAPLLAEGSARIQEMVDNGMMLSGVNEGMADSADQFNDKLAELQAGFGGVANAIGAGLLPTMITIIDAFKGTSSNMATLTAYANAAGVALKVLVVVGASIAFVFDRVIATTAAAAVQIMKLASLDFSGVVNVGRQFLGNSAEAFAGYQKFINTIISTREEIAKTTPVVSALAGEQNKAAAAFLDGGKAAKENEKALLALARATKDGMAFEANQAQMFYDARDKATRDAEKEMEALVREGQQLTLAVDPIAKMNYELERSQMLLSAGVIDLGTYQKAATRSAENAESAFNKSTEQMSALAIGFQTNIQRSMGQGLYDIMQGNFSNIGSAFLHMLQRMLADALAADIAGAIFGKNSGGPGILSTGLSILGSVAGLFGGIGSTAKIGTSASGSLSGMFGASARTPFPSFDVGTPYVPQTGLALIHQGERIIPAAENKGSMGTVVTYAPVINIDSRVDRADVFAITSRAVMQGNADLVEKLQRQGVL